MTWLLKLFLYLRLHLTLSPLEKIELQLQWVAETRQNLESLPASKYIHELMERLAIIEVSLHVQRRVVLDAILLARCTNE